MCLKPIEIYDRHTDTTKYASCRKCSECLQVRANEWALRGYFELAQHGNNCFITLTYKNNPIHLIKKDMQDFIKRLRKKIDPLKIKYFSCGEYGDRNLRPHFHIIIFGYDFRDKRMVKMSSSGKAIYSSTQLDKLWPKGIAVLQDANENTVRYSALYAAKKKQDLPKHLQKFPEFNTMSQNLGIELMLKKMETYLKTDQIYMNGFAYKIPNIVLEKYYKKKYGLGYYMDHVETYKTEMRNYHFPNQQIRETKRRLSEKRKLHQKLKEL